MRKNRGRCLGVDLHHDSFLVCTREGGQKQFQQWKMEQIEEFVSSLQRSDCLAVEATGNTRWFCQTIREGGDEGVNKVNVENLNQRFQGTVFLEILHRKFLGMLSVFHPWWRPQRSFSRALVCLGL